MGISKQVVKRSLFFVWKIQTNVTNIWNYKLVSWRADLLNFQVWAGKQKIFINVSISNMILNEKSSKCEKLLSNVIHIF